MKAVSLVRKIKAMGGAAEIVSETQTSLDGQVWESHKVVGQLNGYDINMHDMESSYFTIRRETRRDTYDQGSDYNPGGFTFLHRLIELDYYAKQEIAA